MYVINKHTYIQTAQMIKPLQTMNSKAYDYGVCLSDSCLTYNGKATANCYLWTFT